MAEAEDKTAALLATLWVKNRPIVEERLATLEEAASALAAAGQLNEDQRKAAQGTAHKLAGALGMYGYDEGTRIAQVLEVLFESATPESGRVSVLVAELRGVVFPQG